jgi:hypothetical protein
LAASTARCGGRFSGNTGKVTIADFHANVDVLQLSPNVYTSFADVLAHAAQVGSNVVIAADATNSITLQDTTLSQLNNNNVHFVDTHASSYR